MDKSKVVSILAPYSPPLAPSQVDAIATEIAKASAEEISNLMKTPEAPKPARKKTRKSKLRK